jgi:hypothetical protein
LIHQAVAPWLAVAHRGRGSHRFWTQVDGHGSVLGMVVITTEACRASFQLNSLRCLSSGIA